MRVTIKTIADTAGVSRGTVDRVLNGRPRVRPEIRERVLAIAAELDYRPNRAGRALATIRRTTLVGVVLPPADIAFFDEVRSGMAAAEADFRDFGIRLQYFPVSNRGAGEAIQALRDLISAGAAGILYGAMDDPEVRLAIDQAASRNIPVITFNSDVPSSRRLCFVGQDLKKSGRIAAALMARVLQAGSRLLAVAGSLHFQAHRDRIDGFIEKNRELDRPYELVQVIEGYDRYEDTYSGVRCGLLAHPDIRGLYMAAGHIGACLDAIKACGMERQIHVICNDRTPEVIAGMQEGIIDFSILQDPFSQGYQSLKRLLLAIFAGEQPSRTHITTECRIALLENLLEQA